MTWWCTGSSLFCCPPFSIVTNNSKDQLDKSALCVTYNRIRAMDACGASTVHSSLPLSTVTSVLTWCLVCFVLCFYFRFRKKEKKRRRKKTRQPPLIDLPRHDSTAYFHNTQTWSQPWWIKKERQSYIFKQGFYSLHAVWHCLTTLNVIHLAWKLTTFLEARQNKERKAVYIFMLFSDDALFCTLRLWWV